MKITETVTRECCQYKDLKPVEGSPKIGNNPIWMYCIHCGIYHMGDSERDAAGGTDWVYNKIMPPWQRLKENK